MTLTFTDDGHRYRLDGRTVPSVTTILNGGIPKPALIYWAAQVTAEAVADLPSTVDELRRLGRAPFVAALTAVHKQRRNEAAVRGTDVHAYAEHVVHGDTVDVPDDLVDVVSGYARWLDLFGLVPELVERPVASRTHGYAGRFDVIGTMRDGQRWLLDIKSSRGVYGDAACQLSAYARAEFYVPADDIVETRLPDIDRIGVVHVTPSGTDLYPMGDIDQGFAEFLAAQTIYAGASRRRRLTEVPAGVPLPVVTL